MAKIINNETSVTQSIDDLFQLPADQKKKSNYSRDAMLGRENNKDQKK